MPKKVEIKYQHNKFMISGELDYSNVINVYQKSLLNLNSCAELEFDFSQLKSSDSTGLALMIEWIKLARQHKKQIKFSNLSQDLLAIVKVAGLEQMIKNN